jgi:hypothetical protein
MFVWGILGGEAIFGVLGERAIGKPIERGTGRIKLDLFVSCSILSIADKELLRCEVFDVV